MNIRQKYELNMLAADGSLDLSKIAELFSIHLRTVRYDIQTINEYLYRELGLKAIEVTNKAAILCDEVRGSLEGFTDLNIRDFYTDRLTGEERALLILFDLCWASRFWTIQEIADKYFVSRGTINTDLGVIKEYCAKNGIGLTSKRGKGICITADELERRRSLAKIIRDFSALTAKSAKFESSIYSQWFEEKALDLIKEIVIDVENSFDTYLNDIAFEALVIHIALSIERFRSNAGYGDILPSDDISTDSLQYKMALDLITRVNGVFSIHLPDAEVSYVAIHVGGKSSAIMGADRSSDIFLEYYCLKVIGNVGKQIGCNLTCDDRLYDSLYQHLAACQYRKKNKMLLENPLKEELIGNYPQLYEVIREVFQDAEELGVIIPSDDEIAYILLHFAAAVNRKSQNFKRPVKVVVVCATGIGTAELVVTGLNRNFQLQIKGTVALHQLERFLEKEDVDLIITTVSLKTKKPYVKVSPLLKEEDIVHISRQILDMGFRVESPGILKTGTSATAKELKELLRLYASEQDESRLIQELQNISIHKIRNKSGERYMLSELINESSIQTGVVCSDWQDAVRKSGQILVDNGTITEEYIQAVIDNVNEVGPYIVITKGVALPHATNKVGVLKTSMSMTTLKNPVNFGSKHNDPVKYVFMLAALDADSHLGALQDLAEFLGRKDFMVLLETADDPESIVTYIRQNENCHGKGETV